ncbi:MAG TPA: hypothetical protein VG125_30670 [Pirellulales bacterium]|jgi:hypothetical protein|nr:hypothetical protein [Pirellulales bacterium]
MSGGLESELTSFHRFISEQLSEGHGDVSPEEALDLWRGHHPTAHAEEDDVLAVREALTDMENGDTGVPLEEFDREFRRRHGLGAKCNDAI